MSAAFQSEQHLFLESLPMRVSERNGHAAFWSKVRHPFRSDPTNAQRGAAMGNVSHE